MLDGSYSSLPLSGVDLLDEGRDERDVFSRPDLRMDVPRCAADHDSGPPAR
jgi:hypothetical protein